MASMQNIIRDVRLGVVPEDRRGKYPFSLPAVASMGRLELAEGATIFVGENGSGKSTLVEAIAIKAGFNPEGGTKHFTQSARRSESDLADHLILSRGVRREKGGFFLRAETMFNVTTEAESYSEYGWENLHDKSHGEAFLWVAENRFWGNGLYILDEPEAALSPQRQLALLAIVHDRIGKGSQFIIATHSPILMALPGALLYELGPETIRSIDYRLTEHFAITKSFLMDPEGMMRRLFASDEGSGLDARHCNPGAKGSSRKS